MLRSHPLTETRWASVATSKRGEDGAAKEGKERDTSVTARVVSGEGQDAEPEKKRGRPRKTLAIDEKATNKEDILPSTPEKEPLVTLRSGRRRSSANPATQFPPRLTALASPHHHNLRTFLRYASLKNLNPTSNVYKGTHYEYTTIRVLASRYYNFQLYRTGRANDLGIDLLGWWKLPGWTSASPATEEDGEDGDAGKGKVEGGVKRKRKVWRKLKVLIQCKAVAPKPAMIRELEGAYVGAPAGWSSPLTSTPQSDSPILALLISTGAATKGVLAALQRSRWPMGLLQITREGEAKQFLWNAVAADSCGLGGLGVTVRYEERRGNKKGDVGGEGEVKRGVRLTWLGKVWRA